jgi:hypothetical protein
MPRGLSKSIRGVALGSAIAGAGLAALSLVQQDLRQIFSSGNGAAQPGALRAHRYSPSVSNPSELGTGLTPSPDDGEVRRALARKIQLELHRVGCYVGPLNGVWDDVTRRSMMEFLARHGEGTPALADHAADYVHLTLLQSGRDGACGPSPTLETPRRIGTVPSAAHDASGQRASIAPTPATPTSIERAVANSTAATNLEMHASPIVIGLPDPIGNTLVGLAPVASPSGTAGPTSSAPEEGDDALKVTEQANEPPVRPAQRVDRSRAAPRSVRETFSHINLQAP